MSLDDSIEPAHAQRSPSAWERWPTCTASVRAAHGLPDSGSPAARWGTANHLLSETCLLGGGTPEDHLGRIVIFWYHAESESRGCDWMEEFKVMQDTADGALCNEEHAVVIDQEQVDCATKYVAYVYDVMKGLPSDAVMRVEHRVRIDHITGERDAKGTSDVTIIVPSLRLIIVIDLKGGMMEVSAWYEERIVELQDLFGGAPRFRKRPNMQLGMYASGAMREAQLFDEIEFERVELHICQPRISNYSTFTLTPAELQVECDLLTAAINGPERFAPSEKACVFCRAKDTCKARNGFVKEWMVAGFTADDEPILRDVPDMRLGEWFEHLGMFKGFLRDIEKRVFNELRHGRQLEGAKHEYKLIPGSQGNRNWSDEVAVAMELVSVPESFTIPKLKSPAQIEELTVRKRGTTAPVLSKERWEALTAYIGRAPPSAPKIVLASDPTPGIANVLDGFTGELDGSDFE